jgi:uncharacterized protein (TIGR02611 family)
MTLDVSTSQYTVVSMRLIAVIRKIAALLIGLPLLVVGIILIPAPGPGLLVCFLALFILSREFSWANTQFEKIKTKLHKIYTDSKQRADRIGKGE